MLFFDICRGFDLDDGELVLYRLEDVYSCVEVIFLEAGLEEGFMCFEKGSCLDEVDLEV